MALSKGVERHPLPSEHLHGWTCVWVTWAFNGLWLLLPTLLFHVNWSCIQNKCLALEPEPSTSDHSTKSGPCLLFSSVPCESGVVGWSKGPLCFWRVWMESPGFSLSWLCRWGCLSPSVCAESGVPVFLLSFGGKKGVYLCLKNCVKFLLQEQIKGESTSWRPVVAEASVYCLKSYRLSNMSYGAFSSTHKSWRRIRVFHHVPTQANTISCSWN